LQSKPAGEVIEPACLPLRLLSESKNCETAWIARVFYEKLSSEAAKQTGFLFKKNPASPSLETSHNFGKYSNSQTGACGHS
jgi:hypothetical protein